MENSILFKMAIFSKLLYRYDAIQNSSRFCVETNKQILKILWKLKGLRTAETILKKQIWELVHV